MCIIISSQLLEGTRFKLADALFRDAKLLCYPGESTPGPSLSKNVALSRCKMAFHMRTCYRLARACPDRITLREPATATKSKRELRSQSTPAWCLFLAGSI